MTDVYMFSEPFTDATPGPSCPFCRTTLKILNGSPWIKWDLPREGAAEAGLPVVGLTRHDPGGVACGVIGLVAAIATVREGLLKSASEDRLVQSARDVLFREVFDRLSAHLEGIGMGRPGACSHGRALTERCEDCTKGAADILSRAPLRCAHGRTAAEPCRDCPPGTWTAVDPSIQCVHGVVLDHPCFACDEETLRAVTCSLCAWIAYAHGLEAAKQEARRHVIERRHNVAIHNRKTGALETTITSDTGALVEREDGRELIGLIETDFTQPVTQSRRSEVYAAPEAPAATPRES